MTRDFTNKNLSRRQLLKTLAALGVTLPAANALFDLNLLNFSNKREAWLSAQGRDAEQFSLGLINPEQHKPELAHSAFRGHGLCQNPVQAAQVAMIARRPGTQGIVVNLHSGEIEHNFQCTKNYHMQGHACFSHDGQFLFSSESNLKTGQGKIIVRETQNFKQVHEFSSHGIGPHELLMMPNSHNIVVANGGLLTHPDSGRKVLNYEDMYSSLTYICLLYTSPSPRDS